MNIDIDISMGYHNEYLNVIIHMCKSIAIMGKWQCFRQIRKSAWILIEGFITKKTPVCNSSIMGIFWDIPSGLHVYITVKNDPPCYEWKNSLFLGPFIHIHQITRPSNRHPEGCLERVPTGGAMAGIMWPDKNLCIDGMVMSKSDSRIGKCLHNYGKSQFLSMSNR